MQNICEFLAIIGKADEAIHTPKKIVVKGFLSLSLTALV